MHVVFSVQKRKRKGKNVPIANVNMPSCNISKSRSGFVSLLCIELSILQEELWCWMLPGAATMKNNIKFGDGVGEIEGQAGRDTETRKATHSNSRKMWRCDRCSSLRWCTKENVQQLCGIIFEKRSMLTFCADVMALTAGLQGTRNCITHWRAAILCATLWTVKEEKAAILGSVRLATVNLCLTKSHTRGVAWVVTRELLYMCFSRQEKSGRGQTRGGKGKHNECFVYVNN